MSWRKGTVLTVIWGGAFAISVLFLAVLISFLNDWNLELTNPRQGLPLAIAVLFGVAFDIVYFIHNRHRHFLFVYEEQSRVAAKVRKKFKEKGIAFTETKGGFKRVPWRDEPALVLTTGDARIHIVEKTVGADVVLESDDPAPYRRMLLNVLR